MSIKRTSDLILNPRAVEIETAEHPAGSQKKNTKTRAIQDSDISVVSVVTQDSQGRVLLLRRSDKHKTGVWENPGGHRESGESIEEAGAREVKEETGLDIRIVPGRAFFTLGHDKGHVGVMLRGIVSGGELDIKEDEHDLGYWVKRSRLGILKKVSTHNDFYETVKKVLGAEQMGRQSSETRDEDRDLIRTKQDAYPYSDGAKQSKALQDIMGQDPTPAWESLWHLSLQRNPSYDEFSEDRAVDDTGKYKGTLDDPEIDGGLDKGILPNVYKVVASLNMTDTISLTRQGRNRVVASAENHYDLQAFSKKARRAGFSIESRPNCRVLVSKDLVPGGLGDKCPDVGSIEQGGKVEKEHTRDPELAQEIARDHLVENPKYYEELKKVEGSEGWNPNPWAVCNKSVGTKKTKKQERCIQDVKKKQAGDNAWSSCDELVGKDDQEQYRACVQDQKRAKTAADPNFTVTMDPTSTLQKELQPLGNDTQVRPGAGGKVEIKTQDPQKVIQQVAPPAPGSLKSIQNQQALSSSSSGSGNPYYASLANVVATDILMGILGREAKSSKIERSPEEIEQSYRDSFQNLEGLLVDYVMLGQNQGLSMSQSFESVWLHFLYDKQHPESNPDFGGVSRKEIYDRFRKLWEKAGGDTSPALKGRVVGPRGSKEASPAAPVEAPPVPKTKPVPAPAPAPTREPDPFDPPRPAQLPEPTNKKKFGTRKLQFYV